MTTAEVSDGVLRKLAEGTALEPGEEFFPRLVRGLAETLGTYGAWVTEYLPGPRRLRAHAFWLGERYVKDYEYNIAGTPCERVVDDRRVVHVPDRVAKLYPKDPDLKEAGAVSYLGAPLLDLDGTVLGHLATLDLTPRPEDPRFLALFQIFAGRAAAEMRRLRAQAQADLFAAEAEAWKDERLAPAAAGGIAGRSEPARRVRKLVEQAAATGATVLILGETGTEKELVARAVHAASGRKDGPMVTVPCAAIPASLIESELFGHEKGAFTGATRRRLGRFALADRGTIFLDEVGELPVDMQAKLLRVLQQGEFEPAGSTRTRKVDVRIVAATSRDLEKDVRESRFRHDLFFRLNVSPIPLPPLRRRGQDVVLLAEAFVEHDAKRLGRKVEPLSPASVRALESYAWPGNVRELRNVIERAVIVSTDGRLDLSHLLRPAEDEGRILTATEFQALERDNLRRALEACGGRVSGAGGAAAMLGMRPSTLSSRMKTLKLKRP